jgi:TPR repeat protein
VKTENADDAEYYYKLGKAWQYHEDYAKAVRCYHLAVDKGHSGAQFNLGIMFEIGLGVGYDFAEAARLYGLAAAQNHAEAAHALGIMYENGLGVAKDYAEAVQWYIKALKQGNADATKALHRLTGHS